MPKKNKRFITCPACGESVSVTGGRINDKRDIFDDYDYEQEQKIAAKLKERNIEFGSGK